MTLKQKFAVAAVTGFVGFIAALPWENIVSGQTAALIVSGMGAISAVLVALKIVPTK